MARQRWSDRSRYRRTRSLVVMVRRGGHSDGGQGLSRSRGITSSRAGRRQDRPREAGVSKRHHMVSKEGQRCPVKRKAVWDGRSGGGRFSEEDTRLTAMPCPGSYSLMSTWLMPSACSPPLTPAASSSSESIRSAIPRLVLAYCAAPSAASYFPLRIVDWEAGTHELSHSGIGSGSSTPFLLSVPPECQLQQCTCSCRCKGRRRTPVLQSDVSL